MNIIKIESLSSLLQEYCEKAVIPRYSAFDKAHREDHVRTVIEQSLVLARFYPEVNVNMVYAAAAYHDTGLTAGRETHHIISGQIIREDAQLHQWFSDEQIETIAQAAEDHRASSKHEPRSIYGRILAEADRIIDSETIIRRTIQYGIAKYPDLTYEQAWNRTLEHLQDKYGYGGYLHLYIPESPNAARLENLRKLIADPSELRVVYDRIYKAEINSEN